MPTATIAAPVTNTLAAMTDAVVAARAEMHERGKSALLRLGDFAIKGYNRSMEDLEENSQRINAELQQYHVDRAMNVHEGWRLHLNFDKMNTRHKSIVNKKLADLRGESDSLQYTIGDTPDPQYADSFVTTIRVGSLTDAVRIADVLERDLADILTPMTAEVAQQDVPVSASGKVWGRFSVYRSQPFEIGNPNRFAEWGPDGVPYMMFHVLASTQPSKEQIVDDASTRLSAVYGDFFDGNGAYAELVARKERIFKK